MTETIKNTVDIGNPITKLRKESKVLTHLYNYPILKEIDDFLLSFYIINYIVTLTSQLILDFKAGFLDQYLKFVVDGVEYIDGLIDIYILSNIDHYVPFVKSLHLKDLYPWVLLENGYKYVVKQYNEFITKTKPIVTKNTDPILHPINSNWSKLNDEYLPKTVESIAPDTSSNELNKSWNLAFETFDRSKKFAELKFNNVKEYPVKISNLYNENLSKSNQNIPKALANTSIDLSNKTLSNLGLKPNEAAAKVNGNGNGNGAGSTENEPTVKVINGQASVNGEIPVGA